MSKERIKVLKEILKKNNKISFLSNKIEDLKNQVDIHWKIVRIEEGERVLQRIWEMGATYIYKDTFGDYILETQYQNGNISREIVDYETCVFSLS